MMTCNGHVRRSPAGRGFFETLTGSRSYVLLYRLHHVKGPEARPGRTAGYIELLREGGTLK